MPASAVKTERQLQSNRASLYVAVWQSTSAAREEASRVVEEALAEDEGQDPPTNAGVPGKSGWLVFALSPTTLRWFLGTLFLAAYVFSRTSGGVGDFLRSYAELLFPK